MSFPDIQAERRTNDSFRNRIDALHHKETSPLERLGIDMVYDIPGSDSLHLFDFGSTKRSMIRWIYGEKGYNRKWNKNKVALVSRLLENCDKYMPSDFVRGVRNLDVLRKWKALEFRTLLLYVGMVVLKDVLPKDEYDHFLLYSCAVRICSCKLYKDLVPIAEKMFQTYIRKYISLYGEQSITSNVHLLAHVCEDMRHSNVDNVMELSTYRYEDCLGHLKDKLKHGNNPLEQVCRRILESMQLPHRSANKIFESSIFVPQMFYPARNVPSESTIVYNKIQITPDVSLSNRQVGNSWFLTKDKDIVKMKYSKTSNGKYIIVGEYINNKTNFFDYPLTSSKLNIFISDGVTNSEFRNYDLESVMAKMVCLPYNDQFVFIPLLHSMESLNSK